MTKLDEIMTAKGLKNPQLARLAKCAPVEIWRLRKGPENGGRKMTPEWAERLAPLLNVAPSDLLFLGEQIEHIIPELKHAAIRGDVAAGRWFEQSDIIDEDLPLIPFVPGKFKSLEQFAFRVVGPSMDLKRICHGDFVVCVPYFDARREITDGDIAVIERRNGQLIERTCKEIKLVNGGYELWPRSTDPRYQEPIRVPSKRSAEASDGTEIEVVGLVIWRGAPL